MALRPLMTDSELKHRKRLQSKVSVVGSTLGLTALGAKGVGSAAPKIARLGARGAGIKQRADKVTEAGLIGSAGVGGLGGYNFAAIQNAEARKRPRQTVRKAQKRKSLQHEANKVAGGTGLAASGGLLIGGGLSDLGSARRLAHKGANTKLAAESASSKFTAGKLYGVGHDMHTLARKKVRTGNAKVALGGASIAAGSAIASHGAQQIQNRARRPVRKEAPAMLDFGLGPVKQGSAAREEEIIKAYDPEANRQKNMNRAATAFAAGSGALAAGAALTGKKAYKPLKAMAGTKRGSTALKNGGKTAVLGAGSFGAAVTSDRILGHKNGRGGRYRPLRERGF